MAILDSSVLFDPPGTALTVSRASTNVIDISNARDIGVHHRNLYLIAQATTALVGPAGTTLNVQYQGSVDNATFLTILESGVYPAVAVPQGRRFLDLEVPRQSPNPDTPGLLFRYFRLNYIVAGGPLTAGSMFGGLQLEKSDLVYYPKNFSINS